MNLETKAQFIVRASRELFAQRPEWPDFFREIFGETGAVDSTLTVAERRAFKDTAAYRELQQMLTQLRALMPEPKAAPRVITVRLPASLHVSLKREANRNGLSMNKLCIAKLVQMIDAELLPRDEALAVDEYAHAEAGA